MQALVSKLKQCIAKVQLTNLKSQKCITSSIGEFEILRMISSLQYPFGGLPSTFKNKNEVLRKWCKVYIPRQKKRSHECISRFNWQKFEVSRKMSFLGLMNSQYNIARFNWKIWCLTKENFMRYLMVCQAFQKQEWNPTKDGKSSINKFVI